MLSDSWKTPSLAAPSPKKQRHTVSLPSTRALSPAPVATGIADATMPDSPRLPTEKSARCMLPPLPPQTPPALPSSSAISGPRAAPLAIG